MRVAILDADDRLVGYEEFPDDQIPQLREHMVIVPNDCDLPTNGLYKYDRTLLCFMPLGAGYGKPSRPPVPPEQVIYHLVTSLQKHFAPGLPDECAEYAKWYEKNIKPGVDETRLAKAILSRGKS